VGEFNKISLDEFARALRFTDQVYNGPFSIKHYGVPDRVNEGCRLAEEMVMAMIDLTNSNSMEEYKITFSHYKIIFSIWILLYDPDLLAEPKQ